MQGPDGPARRPPLDGGDLSRAMSDALVALHRKQFGRGPGAAKTHLLDDLVLCVLTDVFTHVERTLIDTGQSDRVRETRLAQQIVQEVEYRAVAERLTGRSVTGFISSVGFDPDVAIELFLLEAVPQAEAA